MTADPYRYFRIEAHDLVAELQRGVLDLERGVHVALATPRILRAAHTLKSAARVVRQREMGDLAHRLEDTLAPIRDLDAAIARDDADTVRALVAEIAARLLALDPAPAPAPAAPSAPRAAAEDPFRVVRADVADVDDIIEGLSNVHVELGGLRAAALDAEQARRFSELLAAQIGARPGESAVADGIRARAMADDLRSAIVGLERRLASGLERMEREIVEVREAAERLRLVPASVLLDAVERTARDAAQSLGRRIQFRAVAGDVRLDAHMSTIAQDALVQMVKNAVAHGVEPAAERRAAGKPSEGAVTLEITRHANRISFTCRDDGRGVDLEAVRIAAERKGVLGENAKELGAAEILELLLKGGLSTAATVTAIAGRGVGMDVVREAAARLGGQVSVRSDRGRGTAMTLVAPALLSALDVLLVEVDDRTFGVPVEAVRGTRRIPRADITRRTEGDAAIVDGQAVAFSSMAHCLGLPVRRTSQPAESALLVASGDSYVALGVDRLIGLSHMLVRPLPELAPEDKLVAGVALDALGHPIIVLDAKEMLARARGEVFAPAAAGNELPILVVDDSLTTRMLEQSILEAAGYRVALAVSAEDALVSLERETYALLLVDVEMPGMDGFSLIARLRAEPRWRALPAILVTSRNAAEDRARGDAVGASGYMVKGEFDQAVLLARIAELIR
jgi:two-component system chemotaxis sensor kinase CheA